MAEIRKLRNYINGEWVESKTDKYEDVVNPATKEVLCQVPISTREDIEYMRPNESGGSVQNLVENSRAAGRESYLTITSF